MTLVVPPTGLEFGIPEFSSERVLVNQWCESLFDTPLLVTLGNNIKHSFILQYLSVVKNGCGKSTPG